MLQSVHGNQFKDIHNKLCHLYTKLMYVFNCSNYDYVYMIRMMDMYMYNVRTYIQHVFICIIMLQPDSQLPARFKWPAHLAGMVHVRKVG